MYSNSIDTHGSGGRGTGGSWSRSMLRVIARELCELPVLRGFDDDDALNALAARFEQREYRAGEPLVEAGQPAEHVFLIAHGKVNKIGAGKYGAETVLDTLAEGDHFGDESRIKGGLRKPRDRAGQAAIELAAGHAGEAALPVTFVDYEASPREYELGVAQAVRRVHARSADLKQRLQTRGGPPTPDDLDELLCRRRKTRFFLAHPRTIAAFGRECSRRGVYPTGIELQGSRVHAWRGVPLLPCDKVPIARDGTCSILALRTGKDDQGVIGLHRTGLPDEVEPGISARRMDVDEKAVTSYLVTTYFSAAVLVPDALGVLENVQLGR